MSKSQRALIEAIKKCSSLFEREDGRTDDGIFQQNYYVPTKQFKRLLSLSSSMVLVGRYGVGKSVLARKIQQVATDNLKHVIPIFLDLQALGAELREAQKTSEYRVLCESMLYANTIATFREFDSSFGISNTGQFHGLIARLTDTTWPPSTIPQCAPLPHSSSGYTNGLLRQYRTMVDTLKPQVHSLWNTYSPLVVLDAINVPDDLADPAVRFLGALIHWLSQGSNTPRFVLTMPMNLRSVYKSTAQYTPQQDIFHEIEWSEPDLCDLVYARVAAALGGTTEPQEWLAATVGWRPTEAWKYSFGRPRDYVKLVRRCFDVRLSNPTIAEDECWREGLKKYSRDVLDWLETEWQCTEKGFASIRGFLSSLADDELPPQALQRELEEERKKENTRLGWYGPRNLMELLEKWGLISPTLRSDGDRWYAIHPVFRIKY